MRTATTLGAGALIALAACGTQPAADSAGSWKAVLDLAGGPLPFALEITRAGDALGGRICNGSSCGDLSAVAPE
jgi:hypothetical protein